MKIEYVSNNFTGNLIVTVFNLKISSRLKRLWSLSQNSFAKLSTMTWITSTEKSALRLTIIMNICLSDD